MKFINMKNSIILYCICLLIVACQRQPESIQGYVDADYTYISSNFAGNLIQLYVARGNSVSKGQRLFALDVQPEKSQLQNAQAHAAQATADLKKQQLELNYQTQLMQRYQKLLKSSGISREEFDTINHNYQNAQASVKSMEANLQASLADLEKAKWDNSNKMIIAPVSGYVYDTYYSVGELVPATRPVLSLVALENLKIIFYISEPLLKNLRLNQKVNITCDGCSASISAAISYISSKAEYTPPFIYSENTRTKFIYLIEAKPAKSALLELHPGQPVSVILSDKP